MHVYSDIWDSYDQCEHPIPDVPDGQRFLRRDRKHFYFEGTVPDFPDIGDFYDECEHEICFSGTVADNWRFYYECEHKICLSGTSGTLDFVFTATKA